MKGKIAENIFGGIICIIAFILVLLLANLSLKDLADASKAETTLKNLKELRVALEEYYELTGRYPELTKDGVADNLKLLDYVDNRGNIVSFAKIYKKNKIEVIPNTDKFEKSNKVIDKNNFNSKVPIGGWNYDFSGQTGEIHANLPYNAYSQGIKWSEY